MKIFMTQIFHPLLLLMSKINLYREWKTEHTSRCECEDASQVVIVTLCSVHSVRHEEWEKLKIVEESAQKVDQHKLHKLCLFFPPWKWVSRSQAQPARMQRGCSLYNTERRRLESAQRSPPDELVHRTTIDLVSISLVAASETRWAFPFMHIKNTQSDVSMYWTKWMKKYDIDKHRKGAFSSSYPSPSRMVVPKQQHDMTM